MSALLEFIKKNWQSILTAIFMIIDKISLKRKRCTKKHVQHDPHENK